MNLDLVEYALSELHAIAARESMDTNSPELQAYYNKGCRLAVLAAKEIGRPLKGIGLVQEPTKKALD